ncbi:MAG: hypothetical protein D3905_16025, partial [Candidatus Electrothrix sp. AS4_5]|nr:hypothetical protein [Candidatus Electrothrix gigas]
MKKKIILTLTLYVFLLHIVNVHAVEKGFDPYVFRIKADTCSDRKDQNDIECSTRLTGFISKEMRGIVTALHGVVKRNNIHAIDYNDNVFSWLKIEKVDIDHDIALITSHELESKIKEQDGLNFLRRAYSKKDYKGRLYTIGYPIKMIEQLRSDNLSARTPFLRKLRVLLSEHQTHPS